MKRHRHLPEIPPFIDQWGRPTYEDPFGQFRRNPALDATAPPVPTSPRRPVELDVQIQGWETHERHLVPPEPAAPPAPAVPGPVSADDVLHRLRHAQSLGIGEVKAEPAAPSPSSPAVGVEPPRSSPPRTRAERLAAELVVRRTRNRRRALRAGTVAAAGAAVFGVTAAYGFWTGGADAGGRIAKVTVLPVAAEATAGMVSSPLAPGKKGNVKLQVDNPNAFALTLKSVSGGPFPSAVNGTGAGCTVANSGVTFTPPQSLNVTLPPKSTTFVRLVEAAAMGPGAAPECRDHTFTIPVAVVVRKA